MSRWKISQGALVYALAILLMVVPVVGGAIYAFRPPIWLLAKFAVAIGLLLLFYRWLWASKRIVPKDQKESWWWRIK